MQVTNSRSDIQCLRALAVIAVIFFHLWPKYFPNGFLGVDIFFVISGYLMTSIVTRSDFTLSSVLQFYLRRIKRIFPLCIFVIFVTLIVGKCFLLSSYFKSLTKETLWAIAFGTNLRTIFHRQNYFDMVDEYKFLLHTWSLGVEIQFYLLVPIIFTIFSSFKKPMFFVFLVGSLSFIFQVYCIFREYDAVAFNSIFSRVWQFMFGSASFYSMTNSMVKHKKQEITNVNRLKQFIQLSSILLLGLITFLPFKIVSEPIKICVTVTVIFCSFLFISFYQNKIPVFHSFSYIRDISAYLGNASYSLYLTHWPIIVFAKYFNFLNNNCFLIFVFILVTGILTYEIVEKRLISATISTNFVILLTFYGLIVYFCVTKTEQNIGYDKSRTLSEKIALNLQISNIHYTKSIKKDTIIDDAFSEYETDIHDHCSSLTLVKNATFKKEAVLLGNSYVAAQFSAISTVLKEMGFTKIYLSWRTACLPHGGELNLEYLNPINTCQKWIGNVFDKFLIKVKPELIFISARLTLFPNLTNALPSNDPNVLLKNDFGTQQLEKNIFKFSKFAKKIIIISPNPDIDLPTPENFIKMDKVLFERLTKQINFTYTSAANIARNLQLGIPLEEFNLPLKFVYEYTHPADARLSAAIKKCSNCFLFNTTKIFCNKNGCPLYDKESQLAILKDKSHLSNIANEKLVQPLLDLLIN